MRARIYYTDGTLKHVKVEAGGFDVEYFIPVGGGYVRIRDVNSSYPQVCEGLFGTGNTLSYYGQDFLGFIRQQWQKRRRMDRI